MTIPMPTHPRILIDSESTIEARMVAVAGSARINVDAVLAFTRTRPYAYAMLAKAVGTTANQMIIKEPLIVNIQLGLPTKRSGKERIAPREKILNIAVVTLTPTPSARRLVTANSEYEAPAPIARKNPRKLKSEVPCEVAKNMIPDVVTSVANNHRGLGFSRVKKYAIRPVRAGADPSAVTVPMATPVLFTAEKKVIW